jgi:chromate transport protein ChrA
LEQWQPQFLLVVAEIVVHVHSQIVLQMVITATTKPVAMAILAQFHQTVMATHVPSIKAATTVMAALAQFLQTATMMATTMVILVAVVAVANKKAYHLTNLF